MSTILMSGYLSIKLLLVSQWVQTIVSLLIKPDSAIKNAPVSTAIILDEFLWAILNVENNFFECVNKYRIVIKSSNAWYFINFAIIVKKKISGKFYP